MSRISLTEAYNNRDVIAWLTRQQSSIDEIRAFCQFLIDNLPDPNEFVLTIGDVTISGTKTFLESIVAQDGMDLTGLLKVTGTLQVDGDIVQNGSAYDTHAEQLYTTKDNVIMRDGAVSALSAGDTSGFVIKKYDGSNDMNLGVDANGVARLGDSGNELPFLLRDEAADLVDGAPLVWDAANLKAISGSGGGAEWTLRTPNDDWSDLFSYDNNNLTALKNIFMMIPRKSYVGGLAQVTMQVFFPKGIVFPSATTFMLIGNYNGTLGTNVDCEHIGEASIAPNLQATIMTAKRYLKTYTTDGSTVTVTKTSDSFNINKSTVTIYTQD